ncbi:MAG: peptidoglycan-binding domain-containing protein [Archangium sp.]|nr:peptidoglycan-binding domain-containing protein [Archangium sp.]
MNVTSRQPVLSLGTSSPRVKALEQKLKKLGHLEGPVDDRFDARTAAAVSRYKRANDWGNSKPRVGQRMAVALNLPEQKSHQALKGASYNCRIGRNPEVVARTVSHFARSRKLDFIQLQEISGYHRALENIPGYKLITFPGSKDHGETGVLVRDTLETKNARSIEADVGWTNVHGRPAQPRAATSVRIAGWLQVASIHAPPGIDFKDGRAIGPEQRVKSYQSLTRKLAAAAERQQARNPDVAVLYGGDWNEGARTMGPGSPAWLAAQAGMKKYATGGIDWEMARGARLAQVKHGPRFGSDHPLVTFTITHDRR